MNKYTYLRIRGFIGILAALCAVVTVFLPITIANSAWALPIAIAMSLVCAIYCMLKSVGAEIDRYMYPERTHLHNVDKALFCALTPVMVTALLLASVSFGTLLNWYAILMAFAHLFLVILLSSMTIRLFPSKYTTEGEERQKVDAMKKKAEAAAKKAAAMKELDVVMYRRWVEVASQQALRDSLADKTASDVYAAIDALKALHKICPAVLKTTPPPPPPPGFPQFPPRP